MYLTGLVQGLNEMRRRRCSDEAISRKYLTDIRCYDDAYHNDRQNSQVERGKMEVCSTTGFATQLLCSHIKTTCLIFLCPSFLTSEWEIL